MGRIIVYGALGNGTAETRIPLGACFIRGVSVHAGVTIFDYTGNRRLGIAPDRAAVKRAKTFMAKDRPRVRRPGTVPISATVYGNARPEREDCYLVAASASPLNEDRQTG